jgi:hypothetical protein
MVGFFKNIDMLTLLHKLLIILFASASSTPARAGQLGDNDGVFLYRAHA